MEALSCDTNENHASPGDILAKLDDDHGKQEKRENIL